MSRVSKVCRTASEFMKELYSGHKDDKFKGNVIITEEGQIPSLEDIQFTRRMYKVRTGNPNFRIIYIPKNLPNNIPSYYQDMFSYSPKGKCKDDELTQYFVGGAIKHFRIYTNYHSAIVTDFDTNRAINDYSTLYGYGIHSSYAKRWERKHYHADFLVGGDWKEKYLQSEEKMAASKTKRRLQSKNGSIEEVAYYHDFFVREPYYKKDFGVQESDFFIGEHCADFVKVALNEEGTFEELKQAKREVCLCRTEKIIINNYSDFEKLKKDLKARSEEKEREVFFKGTSREKDKIVYQDERHNSLNFKHKIFRCSLEFVNCNMKINLDDFEFIKNNFLYIRFTQCNIEFVGDFECKENFLVLDSILKFNGKVKLKYLFMNSMIKYGSKWLNEYNLDNRRMDGLKLPNYRNDFFSCGPEDTRANVFFDEKHKGFTYRTDPEKISLDKIKNKESTVISTKGIEVGELRTSVCLYRKNAEVKEISERRMICANSKINSPHNIITDEILENGEIIRTQEKKELKPTLINHSFFIYKKEKEKVNNIKTEKFKKDFSVISTRYFEPFFEEVQKREQNISRMNLDVERLEAKEMGTELL